MENRTDYGQRAWLVGSILMFTSMNEGLETWLSLVKNPSGFGELSIMFLQLLWKTVLSDVRGASGRVLDYLPQIFTSMPAKHRIIVSWGLLL